MHFTRTSRAQIVQLDLGNENVPSVERALARSQEVVDELRDDQGIGNGSKFYMPDIHSNEVSDNEAVIITAKRLLGEEHIIKF